MTSLAQPFLDTRPDLSLDRDALQGLLSQKLGEAKEAWPRISIGDSFFMGYLAQRIPEGVDPMESLESLFVSDLYLAASTIQGDLGALDAFNEQYRGAVFRSAQRVEKQGIQPDDATQELMEYLLLPRGERPPALALYSGQGPLLAYVRVSSLRRALKMLKKENQLPSEGGLERVMELADADDDPELAVLKQTYRGEFKEAFHQALGALDSGERNLLRYHYLTDLNTRQIGKLLNLHQSNVVRRLATVRAALQVQTRENLMSKLDLGASKFQSIMMLVQSQLDLSIERVLETQDPPSDDS